MKKNEIVVGGLYRAKVNGNIVTVRVDAIRTSATQASATYRKAATIYDVTNTATGRKTTFRSAVKFRGPANADQFATANKMTPGQIMRAEEALRAPVEGDDSSDPTTGTATPAVAAGATSAVRASMTPKTDRPCLGFDPSIVSGLCRCRACREKPRELRTGYKGGQHSSLIPTDTSNYVSPGDDEPSKLNRMSRQTVAGGLAARLRPVEDTAPHLIIEARAGTGKTTTLINGLKILRGQPIPGFIPSPQQQAVFDAMALSKDPRTICFVAFNKSIATELKARVPHGCEASTMHSMGFAAVKKSIRLNNYNSVNADRVEKIIEEVTGQDLWELRRKEGATLRATKHLVGLCKMNLVDAGDTTALAQLASHYEVDFEGTSSGRVYDLVPQVLERCKDVERDGFIDYDDMIWLPVVLDLPVPKYDILLVDEAQDLNRCQQALAKKAGRRLILCGDPKQAIYGFAGADAESVSRMQQELSEDARGCSTLPLTVTRRCGKAIVREANKIVPDFEAFDTNPEGVISNATYPTTKEGKDRPTPHYTDRVEDGDMVLCRVNAPLVSQCFRFLKMGRRANIQGRDIGQGLISLIKRLAKDDPSVPNLIGKISAWGDSETTKENAKKYPSEARVIAINDRVDCLQCFTEGMQTVQEVIRRIESIFTDDKGKPGILLSSIHKAKGLEASRVFLLQPDGATVPHPMAKSPWQREQEYNLLYVAITRAIKELVYVS